MRARLLNPTLEDRTMALRQGTQTDIVWTTFHIEAMLVCMRTEKFEVPVCTLLTPACSLFTTLQVLYNINALIVNKRIESLDSVSDALRTVPTIINEEVIL